MSEIDGTSMDEVRALTLRFAEAVPSELLPAGTWDDVHTGGEWPWALTSLVPLIERAGIAVPAADVRTIRHWIDETPMFARFGAHTDRLSEAVDLLLARSAFVA